MSNICTKSGTLLVTKIIKSPIGEIQIETCEGGIHKMGQIKLINDSNFESCPKGVVVVVPEEDGKENLMKKYKKDFQNISQNWLKTYFENIDNEKGDKTNVDVIKDEKINFCFPESLSTVFERSVWNTLYKEIGFGSTTTYSQLAGLINNPKAARAVGTALKKNPIQILIPCHRVIKTGGQLGNYAGGGRNKVKEWLLKFEGSYK